MNCFFRAILRCGIVAVGYGTAFSPAFAEDLTFCRMGLEQQQRGDLVGATASYEACIAKGSLTPKALATSYRNLGITYNSTGAPNKAIEFYDKALALNPADPWADLVNRGNAWSALGNHDKALQDYEAALKLRPGFDQAYFNRGIVHEKRGKIGQAKEEFALAYKAGLRSRGLMERMSVHGIRPDASELLPPTTPVASMDVFRGVIQQIGATENGQSLCFGSGASVGTVRPVVEAELVKAGVRGLPTPNQVAVAMFTAYPCPFSPARAELRPASEADVNGAWVYPEGSQKLRYPPKSQAWNSVEAKSLPIKCEGIGYYAGGEARTAQIGGLQVSCPFFKATDMEIGRKNPRVAEWALNNGRLAITRADVQGHVEEWDVFTVVTPFAAGSLQFGTGDLVAYLRKERGSDFNAATQFRHLQRLP